MNPIARLFIYILLSISILISQRVSILLLNLGIVFLIFIFKRSSLHLFLERIKPYLIYLPLSGFLFFIISSQISSKSISIIFIDILMATIRLTAMISLMTFYIIEAKSQNILIAIRSIWFSSGLNIHWIDKFILFFEMTIRFFPSIHENWNQTERSQKALSIKKGSSLKDKVFYTAKFIPDFILLNLKKTDVIIENMSMRGLGTEKRRSIYPYLKFKAIDVFLCLIVLTSIIMVHKFV